MLNPRIAFGAGFFNYRLNHRVFPGRHLGEKGGIFNGFLLIESLHQVKALLGCDFAICDHFKNLITFLACHLILLDPLNPMLGATPGPPRRGGQGEGKDNVTFLPRLPAVSQLLRERSSFPGAFSRWPAVHHRRRARLTVPSHAGGYHPSSSGQHVRLAWPRRARTSAARALASARRMAASILMEARWPEIQPAGWQLPGETGRVPWQPVHDG